MSELTTDFKQVPRGFPSSQDFTNDWNCDEFKNEIRNGSHPASNSGFAATNSANIISRGQTGIHNIIQSNLTIL